MINRTKTGLYIMHRGQRIDVFTEKELKKYLNRSIWQRAIDWFLYQNGFVEMEWYDFMNPVNEPDHECPECGRPQDYEGHCSSNCFNASML
jgi:hypothetical protein